MEFSVISQPAPIPNRQNEDSYFISVSDQEITLMVADGATQRLSLPIFQPLWETFGIGTTGARYAAQIVRQFVANNTDMTARNLLLKANGYLREQLEVVVGDVIPENFVEFDAQFEKDPRLFRLALPVCVVTIVKIYPQENYLEFSHAGDTALLIQWENGDVQQLTKDQMGKYDSQALRQAQKLQHEKNLPHLADVLDNPEVREANRKNGLYHNYVSENGKPDKTIGVGVVNGLRQLSNYIQTGTISTKNLKGLLLTSDGGLLPQPLEGSESMSRSMFAMIETIGISGYIEHVRKLEQADKHLDQYPRFKVHDDATLLYIKLDS